MPKSENSQIIEILTSGGDAQSQAIDDLSRYLIQGLHSSFAKNGVNRAFCEDIAHDATLRILEKLDQFAGKSKFKTWAMSIALRMAISELRRKRYNDISLDGMSSGEQIAINMKTDASESPETEAERNSILQTMKDVIEEELSEKQREVLKAGMDGVSVESIAKQTGSNRNAVYKLIHDARQRLRSGIKQAGYESAEIRDVFS